MANDGYFYLAQITGGLTVQLAQATARAEALTEQLAAVTAERDALKARVEPEPVVAPV